MDQEKHYLAILVENDLYRIWETYIGNEEKQKELIEEFVQQYVKNYKTMTEQEVKEHVEKVLTKTKQNMDEIKKERNVSGSER